MYNQAKGFQNKAQENQKNGLLKFYQNNKSGNKEEKWKFSIENFAKISQSISKDV